MRRAVYERSTNYIMLTEHLCNFYSVHFSRLETKVLQSSQNILWLLHTDGKLMLFLRLTWNCCRFYRHWLFGQYQTSTCHILVKIWIPLWRPWKLVRSNFFACIRIFIIIEFHVPICKFWIRLNVFCVKKNNRKVVFELSLAPLGQKWLCRRSL